MYGLGERKMQSNEIKFEPVGKVKRRRKTISYYIGKAKILAANMLALVAAGCCVGIGFNLGMKLMAHLWVL